MEKQCVKKRHGPLLPETIRALVCGSSNCGKTNLIINLIESPYGITFDNLYVYSKSLHQPKYDYVRKIFSQVPEIEYREFTDKSKVLDKVKRNSVIIFDDVVCENQNAMRNYFSMGRHSNVDCFYLCQTYSKIPKQLIRDNANLIILFRQDMTNLKHAYNEHVNTDMSFKNFINLCGLCWKDKYGFLLIDKDRELNNGRYRRGFNEFAQV